MSFEKNSVFDRVFRLKRVIYILDENIVYIANREKAAAKRNILPGLGLYSA